MSFVATVYGDDGTSAQSTVTITAPPAGFRSLGFWPAWETDTTLSTIPWNALTQVSLFALQTTAGTALDTAGCSIDQINVPAWVNTVHSHGKQALITIGGISDQHWDVATNATNRAGFVSNLVNYMVLNGFDGVDIDIEQDNWGSQNPPVAAWNTAVQAIATAAHAATTQAGQTPIVTTDIDQTWMDSDLGGFAQYVDQINLMGYASNASTALMTSQVQDLLSTGKVSSAQKLLMGFDCDDQTISAAQVGVISQWASTHCGGVMCWTIQGDHRTGSTYPHLSKVAPYVGA